MCVLFSVACVVCAVIMAVQKIWCIKYNKEILIFRNSFGLTKTYYVNELVITDGERMSCIIHNGKVVIQWDSFIMNIKEDVALCKFLSQIR